MTKKEGIVHIEETHSDAKEQGAGADCPPGNRPPEAPHTEIKNANAAGLGAIGRPDEPAEKPGEENAY